MNKTKTLLFTAIILLAGASFLSYSYVDQQKKEQVLIGSINDILSAYHYQPQTLGDSFSEIFFDSYVESLDYNKTYLLQPDIEMLSSYRQKLDDEIKNATFNFFNLSVELIEKRTAEVEEIYEEILEKPFDFSIDETIVLDEEKQHYAKDEKERYDLWRKRLKYQVLDKIVIDQKEQEEKAEKNDTLTLLNFDDLEKRARKYLVKKYANRFQRIDEINREDRLSYYINAFANCFDPHTGYFPPKDKEDFDISISGKLEGIGATLSVKDEYVKVVRIVPGSASWRQGDLAAEDLILKVGQDEEEPVDIVGMRLDEAVQLIRGPKGSKVVLTVKKIDGTMKKIPIIRDVVVLEETYAKSTILTNDDHDEEIGYIYLPKFYVDFNNSKGRRCSTDIKEELKKLKKKNVDGIILDLRDNGGGSLSDVVTIGGYFIESGPIVQVKSKLFDSEIKKDKDPSIEYNGPLIVLVNTFSASASEILAAAMQDYSRAVIVGTQSTYGKGTVQQFIDIDRFLTPRYNDVKPLGALKVTIQKFYRINGGATQLKGVIPDIILNDRYSYIDIGEKELEHPLKWDQIPAAEYKVWLNDLNIPKLKKAHEKRIEKDTISALIEESAKWLKEQRDNSSFSLNYEEYKKHETELDKNSQRFDNLGKNKTGIIISPLEPVAEAKTKLDSVKLLSQEEWHKELTKDVQLYQTFNIMLDMLKQ